MFFVYVKSVMFVNTTSTMKWWHIFIVTGMASFGLAPSPQTI